MHVTEDRKKTKLSLYNIITNMINLSKSRYEESNQLELEVVQPALRRVTSRPKT